MRHRAEACFIDTGDVAADLRHFETQTEGRRACTRHAGTILTWHQPEPGVWQAYSEEYWYRVVSEAE